LYLFDGKNGVYFALLIYPYFDLLMHLISPIKLIFKQNFSIIY